MDPYGGGGGQQQQMMSMSISSVCLVACVAIAAGGFYFMNSSSSKANDEKKARDAQLAAQLAANSTAAPNSGGGTSGGSIQAGMYNVGSGGVSLIVNPDNCTDKQVGFDDPQENDKHAWNFKPVPGRPGYYYVQSEHRLFKKGCDLAYLTADSDCASTPSLDKPVWADRQYWQLLPSGNGQYQLRNAACAAKRAPSYLTSSGVNKGWGAFQMTDRGGTSYNLTPWAAS